MTENEKLILTNQITLMLAIRDWMRPSSYNNSDLRKSIDFLEGAVSITLEAINNAEAKE